MDQYLERWLRECKRSTVRPSTWFQYAGMMRNHVSPRIGGVRLQSLRPAHVQRLLSGMEGAGASPRLRQLVRTVLRAALEHAVRLGEIPRNPADLVDAPRVPRKEMRWLDGEQAVRLLDEARGDRLEALYVLAVSTGLRQGELLGLRWGDVDLQGGWLAVQRQLSDLRGKLELTEPKTSRSRRTVALPKVAAEALRRHKGRLGAVPHPTALVFTDARGGPIRRQNLLRRSFRPLLARAGLPRIRFHDLRHTAATLLLGQGVHVKVVQEQLGHSQISVTLDTYSHVLAPMRRDAASRMDEVLGRAR